LLLLIGALHQSFTVNWWNSHPALSHLQDVAFTAVAGLSVAIMLPVARSQPPPWRIGLSLLLLWLAVVFV
jgi:hypothetical protein